MISNDPITPPPRDPLVLVVLTAAATAFATALATWAVDELRARYGTPADPKKETT